MKLRFNRYAFFLLLLHPVYIAIYATLELIGIRLELARYCNELFVIILIVLIVLHPCFATQVNAASFGLQILALVNKESKITTAILMAITVLIEIITILLTVRFWYRAMGV